MRLKSLVSLVAIMLTGTTAAAAQQPIGVSPWLAEPRPDRAMQLYWKNTVMAHLHDAPMDVLFVGDSITYHYTMGPGKAVWERLFAPLHSYNTGVSGDTTQNTLASIDGGMLNGIHPKVVYLMIGTNDIRDHWGGHDVAKGVEAVVAAIHQKLPRAKILLLDIFSRAVSPTSPERVAVDTANRDLNAFAFPAYVTRLNVNAAFLNPDGTLKSQLFTDGTLHPNADGYEAIAPKIEAAIQALLNER